MPTARTFSGGSSALEEQLRREVTFRRAIEDSMLAGVSAVDLEGTQVYMNSAFASMLGWPAEELVGAKPPFVYWPPEEIGRIQQAFDQTLRGEAPPRGFDLRFQRRGGERFDALVLISALHEEGRTSGWLACVYDVGERRQAERRLRGDEERLRLALEAGRLGAWEWDLRDGGVVWSPELEAIHGLAPGAFEGTFEAFQRDMHPDDRERVLGEIRQVVHEGRPEYRVEYQIVRPDGQVRWLEASGRLVKGPNGSAERMLGVCSDATERKRNERRYHLLAEASGILAGSLDHTETLRSLARLAVPALADWCTVHVRDEDDALRLAEVAHRDPRKVALAFDVERRWPQPPDAPLGLPLVVRTGRPLLRERIAPDRLAEATQGEEHLRLLKDLDLRSSMIVPLRARGQVIGALTLVTTAESCRRYGPEDLDLAEALATRAAIALDHARLYRETEIARAAAERAAKRLRILAGASDRLASSLDYETVLRELATYCTSTVADYCITYSLEPDGSIRRVGLSHAHPEKRPWVMDLVRAGPPTLRDHFGVGLVMRTGEPFVVSEISEEILAHATQNEEHLAVLRRLGPRSSIVAPLRTGGRTIGGLTLAATDDSGRRYGEDDLVLAQELANRAALLVNNARLYGEAQDAVKARDDMMAVVSHDLKNPLQTVLLGCELLRQEESAAATRVDAIRRAADQMDRLVRDLLDVTRLEGGQLSLEQEVVDVRSLLDEALTLHRPLADEKDTALELQAPAALPAVRGDRHRLLQVLSNLIGNAVKFVPPAGRIILSAEATATEVRVAVSDTGPGIPPDQLPHVFDRFWRADRRGGGGTGLGLAIAKAVVETHGGRIEARSEPGHGATFVFWLPTC